MRITQVKVYKAYKESRGIAPLILNLGICWRVLVSITPRLFYPGKELQYEMSRRLEGSQSLSGRFEEENNYLAPNEK